MVSLQGMALRVAVGGSLLLAGCGPNYRTAYEADAMFDRCTAYDREPTATNTDRIQCWATYQQTYPEAQSPERLQQAQRRINELRAERPSSGGSGPGAATAQSPATQPPPAQQPAQTLPTPWQSQPPAPQPPPPAPAPPVQPPTPAPTTPGASPPGSECSSACRDAWTGCDGACANHQPACVATCDDSYRDCMRGCF